MPLVDPSHPLAHLLERDRRYKLDAYLFILEALSYGQEHLGMGSEPPPEDLEPPPGPERGAERGTERGPERSTERSTERNTERSAEKNPEKGGRPRARGRARRRQAERHVSGRELCEAARQYALQQYGYMAPTVLGTWGVHRTSDFGEIVFNMIEIGQMRKTRHDKREDFHDVYDFGEAFSRDLAFVVPDAV
jgi:uncharacterized repeat protein (TIGR04138 family)